MISVLFDWRQYLPWALALEVKFPALRHDLLCLCTDCVDPRACPGVFICYIYLCF